MLSWVDCYTVIVHSTVQHFHLVWFHAIVLYYPCWGQYMPLHMGQCECTWIQSYVCRLLYVSKPGIGQGNVIWLECGMMEGRAGRRLRDGQSEWVCGNRLYVPRELDIIHGHVHPEFLLQQLLQGLCVIGKSNPIIGKNLILQLEIQLSQLTECLLCYSEVKLIIITIQYIIM